jgi:D-3-phosphoglycerate dehydrogenase / 2-oxoglutarate reductase
MTILAAGDHFVLTSLLVKALRDELGDQQEIRELTLPWPVEPFGKIAEVDEASGSEEIMIDALAGAEVCVTQMGPLTERVLRAAEDLRLVAVCRGGPVNVDIAAATARGVRVCYAPGRNAVATAEFTIGMLLAALRRIPEAHASLALRREWIGEYYTYGKTGPEIEGSTVGLIGYGAIGTRVARVLTALGAKVLVHDPYAGGDVVGERVPELDELLRRSRIVTLHTRLTPETRGLIGAREIGLMPSGSVLINVARGALLDSDALCDALESGHLSAAGLDTFAEEPPPPGSRLYDAPNLVMTPHLGGASRAVAEKAARIVAAEVGRYRRGLPLANCVNP